MTPDRFRYLLVRAREKFQLYEMDAEVEPPHNHRRLMAEIDAALAEPVGVVGEVVTDAEIINEATNWLSYFHAGNGYKEKWEGDSADLINFARAILTRYAPPPAPVAVEGSDVRYQFSVFDDEDEEQAGGEALTLDDAAREGSHYLAIYSQDGPHYLALRRVEVIPNPYEAQP